MPKRIQPKQQPQFLQQPRIQILLASPLEAHALDVHVPLGCKPKITGSTKKIYEYVSNIFKLIECSNHGMYGGRFVEQSKESYQMGITLKNVGQSITIFKSKNGVQISYTK